jgi:hypothetical protein
MMAAVVSSVLTVIALPSGIVVGANSLLNESGGDKVDQGVVVDIPQTKVNLLAVVNANKELTAIACLLLRLAAMAAPLFLFQLAQQLMSLKVKRQAGLPTDTPRADLMHCALM